jgi:hypothetical protein
MLVHVSSDDVVLKYVSSSNLLSLVCTEIGMHYMLTISEEKITIFPIFFPFLIGSKTFILVCVHVIVLS